jgi:hypothetical protein
MIDTILKRMKKLTEEEPAETSQEEMLKRFEKVEHQSAQCKILDKPFGIDF